MSPLGTPAAATSRRSAKAFHAAGRAAARPTAKRAASFPGTVRRSVDFATPAAKASANRVGSAQRQHLSSSANGYGLAGCNQPNSTSGPETAIGSLVSKCRPSGANSIQHSRQGRAGMSIHASRLAEGEASAPCGCHIAHARSIATTAAPGRHRMRVSASFLP